jgi:hypothetical protein
MKQISGVLQNAKMFSVMRRSGIWDMMKLIRNNECHNVLFLLEHRTGEGTETA